jgi:hypothetical protein
VKSKLSKRNASTKFVAIEPDLMHNYEFDPKEQMVAKFGELRLLRKEVPACVDMIETVEKGSL